MRDREKLRIEFCKGNDCFGECELEYEIDKFICHGYIEWLEDKIIGNDVTCKGAGQCDHDGTECNENDNCGEYKSIEEVG